MRLSSSIWCLVHLLLVLAASLDSSVCSAPKPSARTRNAHRNLKLRYYSSEASIRQLHRRDSTICLTRHIFELQRARALETQGNISGLPPARSIRRERSTELSYVRFIDEYQQHGVPVVVEGMAARMVPSGMSLTSILAACGNALVKPLYPAASAQWGDLEDGPKKQMTLAEFLNLNSTNTSDPAEQGYLFDFGLPRNCPKLLDQVVMPSYFAQNLMTVIPSELQGPGRNWPSLFVGRRGTRTGLHIDDYSSHFWSLLVSGRKQWRVYPKEDTPALYPNLFDQTFVLKGFETKMELDQLQHYVAPLINTTSPWEFEQRPGDLVLIPYNSPHQVESTDAYLRNHIIGQVYNSEDTISLAGNYWDKINWEAVVSEMRALVRSGASAGYSQPRELVSYLEKNEIESALAALAKARAGAVGAAERRVNELRAQLKVAEKSLRHLREMHRQQSDVTSQSTSGIAPGDEPWVMHKLNLGL